MDTNWVNNRFITLARNVVGSGDWSQNVCIVIDEMNNFERDYFPVIPLVFKIIDNDIIELIKSQYKW